MHEDPADAAVPYGARATSIEVEPDKLVEAAEIVEEEVYALDSVLYDAEGASRMGPPANDIVSEHAIPTWNSLLTELGHSHLARVRDYVQELNGFAHQLRLAAEEYECADDEAAETLRERGGGPG
ncbi:Excreted virulence factor EspC, type VII ESX diderm [Haloechinothrix alba]|uniref:Excreted virulence factor EspC, type VII ESX diderm n=1 Tax=Haloechinothrix alba TaxID=664784 RepID=A0A238YA89_9PSEU|nr:type VII secretion target [Haloechinothrix alba]SNR67728.1 Excreted virulence factor EspC, type VII ESX diderm [Haloechinothrix alba]